MIQTTSIAYKYSDGPRFVFPDINCASKEQLLVLGQSGVGKSTLLHLLGGLMKPTSGRIVIDNQDITTLSGQRMDTFRGNHIGIIFQQNHFIAALSVLDNMLLAQSLSGNTKDKKKCLSLLDRLNIIDKAYKNTNSLSQGERQRVAIARSMVNAPKVILADEPTSALDDDNCDEVIQLLSEQAADENAALIIVTHDGRLKEKVANQIILQKEIQRELS